MDQRSHNTDQESGYILLAVIFMVALLLIALAVAAPRIATSIQRDREIEMIHRGEQYKRAIKLYYKKFGHYPTSIDQLENTSNMRFLRKRYVDPMTGKDDWKIVHLGEAHVKVLGFFGQPISGGGLTSAAGSNPLGAGVGGSTIGSPIGGSPNSGSFGSSSSTDSSSGSSSTTGTDSSSTTSGSTGGSSTTGSTTGTGTGTGITGSGFGSAGQSFGGAPMVGVVSKNTKASLKIYKLQKHYNEWEFVYDPLEDMMQSASLLGGNGSINGSLGSSDNGFSNPGSNSGTGIGGSPSSGGIGGSGVGSGGGFGSSPTSGGFGSSSGGSGFGSSPGSPQ